MVDGFFSCALILSDYVLADASDFFGEGRLGEALLHCFEQVLFVFNHNAALCGQEGVGGLLEVMNRRAEDGAFAECGGFYYVRASHWDKGTACEDYSGERIEFTQIAHSIAEDDS